MTSARTKKRKCSACNRQLWPKSRGPRKKRKFAGSCNFSDYCVINVSEVRVRKITGSLAESCKQTIVSLLLEPLCVEHRRASNSVTVTSRSQTLELSAFKDVDCLIKQSSTPTPLDQFDLRIFWMVFRIAMTALVKYSLRCWETFSKFQNWNQTTAFAKLIPQRFNIYFVAPM